MEPAGWIPTQHSAGWDLTLAYTQPPEEDVPPGISDIGFTFGAMEPGAALDAACGAHQVNQPSNSAPRSDLWPHPALIRDCWEPGSSSEHISVSLLTGRSPRTAFLLGLRWAEKTPSPAAPVTNSLLTAAPSQT